MLGDKFGDAVKNASPRQHPQHRHQLAEVTCLPYARGAIGDGQQLNDQQSRADFDQRARRGPQ